MTCLKKNIKESLLLPLSFLKYRKIMGYREYLPGPTEKRALLSYLVIPLLLPSRYREKIKFSNHGIAQEIPRCLNELGYIVDIVNYDNASWIPQKNYDIFIGHGGINFKHIFDNLPKKTITIYFSTGIYWREINFRIANRIYNLAQRKAYLFYPERFVKFSEEYANEKADGIICLGNYGVIETYKKFPLVYAINNAVYDLNWAGTKIKDYSSGRKHFLFFSGRGNIQKGLDLLLEAFINSDLHLHICQHMQDEFMELYGNLLKGAPNIHIHGFVRMRSKHFEHLAMKCNWIISATCAEGQPGAVLECMGYGLIPILPDSANINIINFGIKLPSCEIEDIKSIISKASKILPEKCKEMAFKVMYEIKEEYTVEQFRKNFKKAVSAIAEKKGFKV